MDPQKLSLKRWGWLLGLKRHLQSEINLPAPRSMIDAALSPTTRRRSAPTGWPRWTESLGLGRYSQTKLWLPPDKPAGGHRTRIDIG